MTYLKPIVLNAQVWNLKIFSPREIWEKKAHCCHSETRYTQAYSSEAIARHCAPIWLSIIHNKYSISIAKIDPFSLVRAKGNRERNSKKHVKESSNKTRESNDSLQNIWELAF